MNPCINTSVRLSGSSTEQLRSETFAGMCCSYACITSSKSWCIVKIDEFGCALSAALRPNWLISVMTWKSVKPRSQLSSAAESILPLSVEWWTLSWWPDINLWRPCLEICRVSDEQPLHQVPWSAEWSLQLLCTLKPWSSNSLPVNLVVIFHCH